MHTLLSRYEVHCHWPVPFQTDWPPSFSHPHHYHCHSYTQWTWQKFTYFILLLYWGSKALCENHYTCFKWRSLYKGSQENFCVHGQAQVYLPRWAGINRVLRLKEFPSFTLIARKLSHALLKWENFPQPRVPQSILWLLLLKLVVGFSVGGCLFWSVFVFSCRYQFSCKVSMAGNCMFGQHDKNLKPGTTAFHRWICLNWQAAYLALVWREYCTKKEQKTH